jgi:hypothetical protein
VRLADVTELRTRKVVKTESKSPANVWGQQLERELYTKGPPRERREVATLTEFVLSFINEYAVANRQKPSGISNKQSVLRFHLLPALGERRLHAITAYDVEKLMFRLKDKSPKTVNNVLTALSKLLKVAAEWA